MLAELLELAPSGVEEATLADGTVEYAVYGSAGELPALPALSAIAGDALVEVTSEPIPDDWPDRWRQFHRPLVIDSRLTVRPPWEPPASTALDVVIDPGQAFGTGAHPTTKLCLELLLSLAPGGALIDLGCGSGVLAITAARLDFGPVLALDNELAAVEASRANAAANHVEIDVRRLDLRTDPLPPAPTVVANLLRPLLIALADRLDERPERLIASGLLRHEADGVAGAFAAHGLRELDRLSAGEWTALLLG